MEHLKHSHEVELAVSDARHNAVNLRQEFVTPEHLMLSFLAQENFAKSLLSLQGVDDEDLRRLRAELMTAVLSVPNDGDGERVDPSTQFSTLLSEAETLARAQQRDSLNVCDIVSCLNHLAESQADNSLSMILEPFGYDDFLENLASLYGLDWHVTEDDEDDELDEEDDDEEEDDLDLFSDFLSAHMGVTTDTSRRGAWQRYARDIGQAATKRLLIGRDKELERVEQVLCRAEKNNPLLIGESGVGKTAIVYGLAARLAAGDVPKRLKGCKVYMLDTGAMMAGSQFKGEMEDRLTKVLEGIAAEDGRAILFIDEMHALMSNGNGDGIDSAGVLISYLDTGRVRVIGTTTYEDYNRRFARNRGLVRRCQCIDVAEPTPDETLRIVTTLAPHYEDFHKVKYDADALELAVRGSSRHLRDRFQPDKAIDLIDEAGAYVQLHPTEQSRVDTALITQVLARMAKVDALAIADGDEKRLLALDDRIKAAIFGQDEAVERVVEAVQMAKAGLTDEAKPLASLLFVGPTGVGKTEVARVLSRELGVKLVRFDMSEYAEKHTVAKFIGSPAGYVGYDDGGQLTDAVRNNPDCVLLFDEIEKAHSDIFDILLQVMDYGVLTDNKGRKAHFQNVVIIMTSNAGAQWAAQAGVGFASSVTAGGAMLAEVKKTFKPEFTGRLSGIVVFRDMDRDMALSILDKKLLELSEKLRSRNVELTVTDAARERLLALGFSPRYGAREMDRALSAHVNTLLMREILFGSLKAGGTATLDTDGADNLKLTAAESPAE